MESIQQKLTKMALKNLMEKLILSIYRNGKEALLQLYISEKKMVSFISMKNVVNKKQLDMMKSSKKDIHGKLPTT